MYQIISLITNRLAEIFAAVMRFDLSASDIYYGTMLTSARQQMDMRERARQQRTAKDVEAGEPERPSRELLEEALHYLPFGSAVYGVPMWLWFELRLGGGLCAGLFKFLCCCLYRVKVRHPAVVHMFVPVF